MTRHPQYAAASRLIRRIRAEENMRLADLRKRETNGSGWEARWESERRVRIYTDIDTALEGLTDE